MKKQINCPNCQQEIDVNHILKHQIESQLKNEFLKERNDFLKTQQLEKETLLKQQQEAVQKLAAEKADFEAKKLKENELFAARLAKETKAKSLEIEQKIKLKLDEENSGRFKAIEIELAEKSEKVKEFHKKEAEIAKLIREKNEMKDAIEAESAKKMNQILEQDRLKIKKTAEEKTELKIKEMQKQLDDQIKLTDDMKRKQEQGSIQLQGEVQELAIEQWLASQFPLDSINEIKKGANGADCMQIVNTREMQNCGKIYYESKRTKAFSNTWIEKFKNDIRDKNADIGVLVTKVLPNDMERMGLKEGIWICTLEEFKGLSAVLRQSVIKIRQSIATQENKGEKMVMLYDFLTSNEFKLQIEGIVEGFTQMQNDLNKEKNTMKRIWKTREKQINKVVNNTLNMYGSIKGIAGNAIQNIKALEMGDENILE